MCLRLIIGQQQERWRDKKNDHCSVLCGEERCKKKTNENIDDTQHSGRFNVLHLTKKKTSLEFIYLFTLLAMILLFALLTPVAISSLNSLSLLSPFFLLLLLPRFHSRMRE